MKPKTVVNCTLCNSYFTPSLLLPFSQVCAKCSDAEPVSNFVYDEEDQFDIQQVVNVGGRVPAVFDSTDDSFGY